MVSRRPIHREDIAIRIETLSGDFARALSPDWEDFQHRASHVVPFVHPDYLSLWSRTLGKKTRPRVMTAWHEGELVGYAPFMQTREALGPLPVSSLRFIGNTIGYPGDILYTDIVTSEPRKDIVRRILSHAKDTCRVRTWDFGSLHPRSYTGQIAKDLLSLSEIDAPFLSTQWYVTLRLPSDWDAYVSGLSRATRKGNSRRLHKLERLGDLGMRVDKDPETAARRVIELVGHHEKWWRDTPKEGWWGDATVQQFYKAAARLLAHQGHYLIFTLELDGTPIGWNVGAFHSDRYFSQMSSYDRNYAAYSPGMILSFLFLRHLHSMNVRYVEFGPGFNQRKRSLGGQPTEFLRIRGYFGWLRRFVRLRRLWARRRVSP